MRFVPDIELSKITCARSLTPSIVKRKCHRGITCFRLEVGCCGQSVNVAGISSSARDSFGRATNPYITSARSGSL